MRFHKTIELEVFDEENHLDSQVSKAYRISAPSFFGIGYNHKVYGSIKLLDISASLFWRPIISSIDLYDCEWVKFDKVEPI